MRIVIAGGHGKIALQLGALLAQRGDEVDGIIRDPGQAPDLAVAGVRPVVLDLERATPEDAAAAVADAAAVVFAAGAGPGSGVARKYTVDEGASNLCVDAAAAAGVPRFIQVSAMGTDEPPAGEDVFSHYLRAKAAAEQHLRASDIRHVILRPGRLTDGPQTGLVQLGRHVPRGSVSRADVAAVIAALLASPVKQDATLELVAGGTPLEQALAALPRAAD